MPPWRVSLLLSGALMGLALTAMAQKRNQPEWETTLRVTQVYDDNATGTRENEPQVRERQSQYALALSGLWQREWLNLEANYEAEQTRFEQGSQSEDDVLEGSATLNIGKSSAPLQLSAGHSSVQFIVDPAVSTQLRSNLQERQIAWYSPTLTARFAKINEASVAYKLVDIHFADDEANDSQREGVELKWQRRLSTLHAFTVSASAEEVRFASMNTFDYTQNSYQAQFTGASRVIEYALSYGVSQVDTDAGESYTRPQTEITVSSRLAGHQFNLFYQRQVSDTSQGNGNNSFFAGEPSFEPTTDQGIEQTEINSAGLNWQSRFPCPRCTTSIALGFERDEFIDQAGDNDSTERFVELQWGYALSRHWALATSIRRARLQSGGQGPEVTNGRWRFGINGQINQQLSVSVEYSANQQNFENEDDISVSRVEASISQRF